MKRLFIIWLLLFPAIIAEAQPTAKLVGPNNVCLNSFATFDCALNPNGNTIIDTTWNIPNANYLYPIGISSGNNAAGTRSVTVNFTSAGNYNISVKYHFKKNSGGGIDSVTFSKSVNVTACPQTDCQGNKASKPFLLETFGTFPNNTARDSLHYPAITTYQYLPSGSVNDGQYIISSNPMNGRPEWVNTSDHTGDPFGGMMIVNASYQPDTFYSRTITNLCAGMQYSFSAWLLNVDSKQVLQSTCSGSNIFPNLSFVVLDAKTGTELGRANTLDVSMNLAGPTWQRYGFGFKTPIGVDSVKLIMYNIAPGGCGNDLAIDDIQFTYCGPTLLATTGSGSTTGDTICAGTPDTLRSSITANYFTNPQYQWQTSTDSVNWTNISGATNPIYIIPSPVASPTRTFYRFIAAENGSITTSTCNSPSNAVSLLVLKTPNISPKDTTICFGGTATLNAQPGYTSYKWSTGATTSSISVSPTATTSYKVSATLVTPGQGSCTDSATATVTVFNSALLNLGKDTSICQGDTISLNATIPGATKYRWSTGDTTAIIRVSKLGTYTYSVTVSYSSYCSATASRKVTVNPLPNVTASGPGSVCAGTNIQLNAASITATKFSWTGPNSFNSPLQNPVVTNSSSASAGLYRVFATDANSCSNKDSVIVAVNPLPVVIDTVTNVSCYGNSNGAISLGVSGGSTPYAFKWSTSAITQNVSGLTAGNYSDTITDAKGCRTTIAATVTQPSPLSITTSVTPVTCFGQANGSINIVATGGTAPYLYSIDGGAFQSSGIFNNLSANTHNITVKDNNSCSVTAMVAVTQPAPLTATASATNVFCNGGNNGSITVTASGGTTTYQYSIDGGAFQNSNIFNNLVAKPYTITVKDANGCTISALDTVTQPPLLTATAVSMPVTCYGQSNGSITITASGGTTAYQYSIDGTTFQGSNVFNNLAAKPYTVTVKDANGCTTSVLDTVNQPSALAATAVSIPVTCYGQSNGSITITASGGTTAYQYSIDGTTFQGSNVFNNLVAKPYTITVKDANGCTTSVLDTVTQPSVLAATAVSIPVTCYGQSNGSITITASGGTTAYQYSIDGTTFQGSNAFNTLVAKPYTIMVKDANGCTISVLDTVNQPSALAATAISTPVTCYGQSNGSITVTASGGTTAYQYSVDGGTFQSSNVFNNLVAKPYTITVKDANGCTTSVLDTVTQPSVLAATAISMPVTCYGQSNGSITIAASGGTTAYQYSIDGTTFQGSNAFNTLVAKPYTITVKDANGCTISVLDTVTQPSKLAATGTVSNVSCNGGNNGAITLTVSGGTGSYTYNWNNGATKQNLSNLVAGTYSVIVKDANGCTAYDTAVVTQPAKLIASHSITNISCNGGNNGAVNLTIGGGTGSYNYNWSNGGTSQNLSNLIAGTYSVIVKDANGCMAYDTATVTQPAKLTTSHYITNVSCNGGNNGAINLTVNGGAGSYIYTWSNGSASQNLSNLVAGTYSVIVKDANGCTAYDTAVVTQPARLAISHAIANITCFGSNNGAITLNVTGGTGAYTFTWNNKAASQDISGLNAGKYSVIITDANGCKATDSAVIAQPPLLTAAASATPITCYGLSNGSIRITASGGTALYQYSLDGTSFQGSNTFNNLAPGSYIAIVRDANSCTTTTQVAITQPDSLAVTNSVINVSCYGGNNGAVSLKVTGGTTPYTFAWNNNAPAQNITGLTAGSYTASITDANGCNARDTAIISQPPLLAFSAGTIPVKCNGGNDGAIIISPSGGTAPYQYSLDGRNFQNNNKFNNLTANTYTVTVRDANGCSISAVEYLATLAPPSIPNVTAGAVCGGGNITLKAAGAQANEDYRWYGDSAAGTLLQTNGNIYTTYPLSQTATFYTTIYNTVTGCESPRVPVIAAVHPLPLVTATGGTACEGGTVQLRSSGGSSYRWTGPGFSSDEQNPAISQITPGAAGIYTIIATDANGCSNTATVPVAVDLPPVVQLGNDTLLAEGTRYVLDAGNPGATYQWNIGVATRQITADTAGTYRVNVSMGACTVSDSVRIRYFIPPVVNLVHDTTLCTGESLTLKATNPGATYKWNDGTTSDTLIVTRPGKYWVEAKKFTATVSDTIQVNYLSPAAINLGRDTVLCQGTPLTLDAGVPGLSYFWNTRERTQKIHIDAPGVYWVIASNGACLARDSIRVSYDLLPAVNLTADTTICRGESLTLNAYNPGAAYLWSTGDTTASVTVNTQNTFGVTVTRGACTVRDSLRLFLNPPPNISLRKDTVLCDGQSLLLDAGSSISTSYRWNDGSSDPVKIINAPGQYWVLATYGICLARDTITVSLRKPPAVQLGSNLSICAGEKVILRPNLKKALFTWNDNSSGDSLTVTQPGKYWLTAMDLQCGTLSSDTVNVAVKGPPAVSLGNDTTICKGEYITLIPKAVDITNYRWQDGSSGSSFRTNQEGIYTVTVANDCGNNSADIRVRTTDCSVTGDLYMPNAFTPNHDGINDFFRPKYFVTITYFEMFVYNRWGQLICRTQNIDKGWDGTFNGQPCDLGTYVWYIRYKKQNDPKEHFKKGDVILVR